MNRTTALLLLLVFGLSANAQSSEPWNWRSLQPGAMISVLPLNAYGLQHVDVRVGIDLKNRWRSGVTYRHSTRDFSNVRFFVAPDNFYPFLRKHEFGLFIEKPISLGKRLDLTFSHELAYGTEIAYNHREQKLGRMRSVNYLAAEYWGGLHYQVFSFLGLRADFGYRAISTNRELSWDYGSPIHSYWEVRTSIQFKIPEVQSK